MGRCGGRGALDDLVRRNYKSPFNGDVIRVWCLFIAVDHAATFSNRYSSCNPQGTELPDVK
jgi:hypothetical protein